MRAIISVPHTGTHALAKHLDIALTMLKFPGKNPRESFVGHCWGANVKKASGVLNIEQWLEVLERRTVYMPIRKPRELAYSWTVTHNRDPDQLHSTLARACELIKRRDIIRVDIRGLKVVNRRGNELTDSKLGDQLRGLYPEYFSDILSPLCQGYQIVTQTGSAKP